MYYKGKGAPQNYTKAAELYQLAGAQGHAMAQYSLGGLYKYGKGVPQDNTEAAKWYHLAAEQGNAAAQYSLGGMYRDGKGVPHDIRIAHMWYNIASLSGAAGASEQVSLLEEDMTPEEWRDAVSMAAVCARSKYQNCEGF